MRYTEKDMFESKKASEAAGLTLKYYDYENGHSIVEKNGELIKLDSLGTIIEFTEDEKLLLSIQKRNVN